MDPLLSRFLDLADQAPDAPVALGPPSALGGPSRWSRGELAARIRRLGELWGDALTAQGRGPGAIVALRVDPGPGFLAAYLACRAARACVLLMDGCSTEQEQLRIATRLGASCLWSSRQALDPQHQDLRGVQWFDGQDHLPDTACLKLTSGSTGDPAGVRASAHSLLLDGKGLAACMDLDAEDRILASVNLSHSYGFSVIASAAWLVGCPVIFAGEGDPLIAAREHGATVMPSIPSWFEAQLAATDPPEIPEALRLFLSAGAPLLESTARAWKERYGRGIHVLYGASECGAISYDSTGDASARGSVGTPISDVRIELDEEGLVSIHSPKMTLGYWPEGDARSEKITGERFQTEDLAHFEGGELFLDGRRSHWINVKGKKVNPREVEAVLREHPAIRDAVVIGLTSPDSAGERVRAVIACEEGALGFADVLAWCKPRLAPHKYPRSLAFCRELPRTGRGKLDRLALSSL